MFINIPAQAAQPTYKEFTDIESSSQQQNQQKLLNMRYQHFYRDILSHNAKVFRITSPMNRLGERKFSAKFI
jgi:hypothetical protein